jgi:hypothetical protein
MLVAIGHENVGEYVRDKRGWKRARPSIEG